MGRRSYDIIVGNKILKGLGRYLSRLNVGKDAYIITNPVIKNICGNELALTLRKHGFNTRFKLIKDTEKSKSLFTAYAVIKDLTAFDKKRKIFIIALGGGVIGDLSGFVASIYKRGIAYIQVPTTLLAQVDSAIGGKTAVDLSQGKNLIGAFYQPRLVYSDVGLLKTLDAKQVRSGLAEVIKYAAIKDPFLFAYLEKKHKDILRLKPLALEFIIQRCSQIKAEIVRKDEREERGIRTVLNFGHTIGHAIEAAQGFKGYTHGEAIALGMLVATDLSWRLGLINQDGAQRIERLIKAVGLPVKIHKAALGKIIKAHYRDKKFIASSNRFVLISGIGKTKVVKNIPLEIIKDVLSKRLG